jgi:hypothetical protein
LFKILKIVLILLRFIAPVAASLESTAFAVFHSISAQKNLSHASYVAAEFKSKALERTLKDRLYDFELSLSKALERLIIEPQRILTF